MMTQLLSTPLWTERASPVEARRRGLASFGRRAAAVRSCGVLAAWLAASPLPACSSASNLQVAAVTAGGVSSAGETAATVSGAASGGSAVASASGAAQSGGGSTGAGTSGGFGTAAGTSGGGSASGPATGAIGTGGTTTGGISVTTRLSGALAFAATFSEEFYGLLPDGGPDLSILDCQISDLPTPPVECSTTPNDGGAPDAGDGGPLDAGSDAGGDGGAGPQPTLHILDVYITSTSGAPFADGVATVPTNSTSDAGLLATLELTLLLGDGGRLVVSAVAGEVAYQATASGISGHFNAVFALPNGLADAGELNGDFGAAYCAPLGGY